jgi:hypothetical protein
MDADQLELLRIHHSTLVRNIDNTDEILDDLYSLKILEGNLVRQILVSVVTSYSSLSDLIYVR